MARLTGEILGVFCELKVWFHIPYQLLQFCIQSGDNIRPRYDGTPLCVLIVPPLTGKSSYSRQERELCTDNIAEKMHRNIVKELKIRECFSMAMCKDLLYHANEFRCIQSWDILHLQNSARLYNHRRVIVKYFAYTFSDIDSDSLHCDTEPLLAIRKPMEKIHHWRYWSC